MRYFGYVEIYEVERLPGNFGVVELTEQQAKEVLDAIDGNRWINVSKLHFDPASCPDLPLPSTVTIEAFVIFYYE